MTGNRRGFTLMELLVVMFIIGLLAALLLPALSRSRGRARRVQCLANLSQVGKAILQTEIRRRKLPAAEYFSLASGSFDRVPLGGWTIEILPDLEESPLYERWDRSVRWFDDASENLQLSQTPLAVFQCPNDPTAAPGWPSLSYVVNGGFAEDDPFIRFCPGVTQSRGSGYVFLAIDLNGNDRTCGSEKRVPRVSYTDMDVARRTGVFFNAYRVDEGRWEGGSIPLSAVRDGLSQTILVSENHFERFHPPIPGGNLVGHSWAASGAVFYTAGYICEKITRGPAELVSCTEGRVHYENANNRATPTLAEQAINGAGLPGNHGPSPWLASGHSGGVNIFLADGSARFLDDQVAGEVFAKLVTPDGAHLPDPLRQDPLSENTY